MKSFFETFLPAIAADKDVSNYRLSICYDCNKFTKIRQCKLCGCFMDLKTKLGSSKCPEGKW